MGIGQDITVGTDDKPRSGALVFILLRHARSLPLSLALTETAEEFESGIVFIKGAAALHHAIVLDDLRRADIDHCGALLFDQTGEIRQVFHLRNGKHRRNQQPKEHTKTFEHIHVSFLK